MLNVELFRCSVSGKKAKTEHNSHDDNATANWLSCRLSAPECVKLKRNECRESNWRGAAMELSWQTFTLRSTEKLVEASCCVLKYFWQRRAPKCTNSNQTQSRCQKMLRLAYKELIICSLPTLTLRFGLPKTPKPKLWTFFNSTSSLPSHPTALSTSSASLSVSDSPTSFRRLQTPLTWRGQTLDDDKWEFPLFSFTARPDWMLIVSCENVLCFRQRFSSSSQPVPYFFFRESEGVWASLSVSDSCFCAVLNVNHCLVLFLILEMSEKRKFFHVS